MNATEYRQYEYCLANDTPYFGPVMFALQGQPIRHAYMQLLVASLCRERGEKAFTILEIGSWAGGSAITWAEAIAKFNNHRGKVICVDPWQLYFDDNNVDSNLVVYQEMNTALASGKIYDLFLHNIHAAGCDDIVVPIRGSSDDVLPLLGDRRFDLVFIDGDHSYTAMLKDLRSSTRLVAVGGTICGDDLELQMHQVDVEYARRNREKDYVRDPRTNQPYHPGVCLAVGEVIGETAVYEGFWAMRRTAGGWEQVELGVLDPARITIPKHLEVGGVPRFVDGYKGFNVVQIGDKFLALARSLGAVNLARTEERTLREYLTRDECFVAGSLEQIRRYVDQADCQRHVPSVDSGNQSAVVAHDVEVVAPRRRVIAQVPAAPLAPGDMPRHNPEPHPEAAEDVVSTLFAAGNYTEVALAGPRDRWEFFAALGLIGRTEEALAGLERCNDQQARFYSAVASWVAGDEDRATRLLQAIPTAHAQNLLALIKKPRIEVLAQLPWVRNGPSGMIGHVHGDSKFRVSNISFHPDDLPNEPYADVFKFVDRDCPPDFYACMMVEWHLVPPNIQELPCPIIGHTADYDVHIQGVYPWLQVFDEMVVTDQTEWRDLRRLVQVPVATFPKSFGVVPDLPAVFSDPRKIDLFMSGLFLHPYHSDKVKPLLEALHLPEKINIWFVDGFLPRQAYLATLCQSKVCFTFVRHAGAMPTRGLEALAMGCATVVQEGSALTLFAGEEEGVLTYSTERGGLRSAILRVADQWPQFEQRARRGAEIIRREFALPRVASQYLRFLTFLAARPRGPRRRVPEQGLFQKRMITRVGWMPGGPEVMHRILEANIAHSEERAHPAAGPQPIIDMARELVLAHAALAAGRNSRPDQPLPDITPVRQALSIMRDGLARFPASLVLRFNLIRTALHYGKPVMVCEALELARQTVAAPTQHWTVGADEDVLPWDFFPTHFNYRGYFDRITGQWTGPSREGWELTPLILASLHFYLGFYEDTLSHWSRAPERDPEFPFYRFYLAQKLLDQPEGPGGQEHRQRARALLAELARGSVVFGESQQLLGPHDGPDALPLIQHRLAVTDRLKEHGLQPSTVDWRQGQLQPATEPRAAMQQNRRVSQ